MEYEIFRHMQELQTRKEMARILSCNEKTQEFGLTLTDDEAGQLVECRNETLREQKRVEFGESILPELIMAFCDSAYLEEDDYAATLMELQEVFFLFKNESMDYVTDHELLTFMREQFDDVCYGSVEYLESTCLERFSRAVRAGYRGYKKSQGKGEYTRVSQEKRWDRELYWEAMSELFG